MANTFTKIETITAGVGGIASVTFSNIPQIYTDLLIKVSWRQNETSAISSNINMQINGLGTNIYSVRRFLGSGTGVSGDTFTNLSSGPGGWAAGPSSTSSTFSNAELYIPNYRSSTNKTYSWDSVTENNATTSRIGIAAGLIGSTAAITQIFLSTGFTILQHSTTTLYAIKSS
jgi:hypothetical protein